MRGNGHPSYEDEMAAAQRVRRYLIGGREFVRVRYGSEQDDWGADRGPCGDCGVKKGQLHVMGCDIEPCPRCGGQVITCGCVDLDDQSTWRA